MGIAGRKNGESIPNPIRIVGSSVYLLLFSGHEAIVDIADYPAVKPFRWTLHRSKTKLYAATRGFIGSGLPSVGSTLHRWLFRDIGEIDHKNGNGLDCRRLNLRPATRTQNNANRLKCGGSSRFKGVTWDRARSKWKALIQINGIVINLGRFRSEVNAAQAYNFAADELFGEFARFNSPC